MKDLKGELPLGTRDPPPKAVHKLVGSPGGWRLREHAQTTTAPAPRTQG